MKWGGEELRVRQFCELMPSLSTLGYCSHEYLSNTFVGIRKRAVYPSFV